MPKIPKKPKSALDVYDEFKIEQANVVALADLIETIFDNDDAARVASPMGVSAVAKCILDKMEFIDSSVKLLLDLAHQGAR